MTEPTNEELIADCPWCEGETKLFNVGLGDGSVVEMVMHNGWPHCCATRGQLTLAQWNHRLATLTSEPSALAMLVWARNELYLNMANKTAPVWTKIDEFLAMQRAGTSG